MDRMQKLGELLEFSREKKKLSIKEASSATKIRESMITALENGDYKIFTSDIHLKSFIKAYAKFLGINEEKAIAMYRRERNIANESAENINKKIKPDFSLASKLSKLFNWRVLTGTVGLLLISVIIYFFYVQIQAFYVQPRLEIISPTQNAVLENDVFLIEGITDNISVKVIVDGNEANFVDSEGRFRVNGRFTQPGPKKFTITAENEFRKKTEVSLDLTYRPRESVVTKQKVRLINKSNTETQFLYTTDAKTTLDTQILRPLDAFEIDFDTTLTVKDFDTNKVDIYLNGNTSPMSSISSSDFTIAIENSIPIIKTE